MPVLIADQVSTAVGQPSSVRVGTVVSTSPVKISIQGVSFTNIGVSGSYIPQIGDTVSVLGQSPTSGSDPTSWLVLGSVSPVGMRSFLTTLTSATNIPLVDTDLVGTEINFVTTAPATLIQAWYSADLEVIGTTLSTVVVRPFLDSVVLSGQTQIVFEMPVAAATGRFTLGQQTQFTVAAGSHQIKLSGITAVGAANQVRALSSTTSLMVNIYG